MIRERIPQIKNLSMEEKRALMNELWEEVRQSDQDGADPALVALLEKRWEAYMANPGSAMTLEEFRQRLGGQ